MLERYCIEKAFYSGYKVGPSESLKIRGAEGRGDSRSDLIWSIERVQWGTFFRAAQWPGNLRDMGGGLIRSWWGELTNHTSHWFAVWICLSTSNQSCSSALWVSWRVLIGPGERAHADVGGCMCVLLSWWDRGREGMLMVSLQLNHWVLSGTGHLTKPMPQTPRVWGRCAARSLCDIRTWDTFKAVSYQRSLSIGPRGGEGGAV